MSVIGPDDLDASVKPHAPYGALVMYNNERGFRCKDLWYFSQVAKSSKKGIAGFIGQKGVGSKCIFVASAKPHIVSGKLQVFYSDEPHPRIPLKYLPPTWIEDEALVSWLRASNPFGADAGGTTLFLPLRSDDIRTKLATELKNLSNYLPIFLPKLHNITLSYKEGDLHHTRTLKFDVDPNDIQAPGFPYRLQRGKDHEGHDWLLCTTTVETTGIEEKTRSGEGFKDYRPVMNLAFPFDIRMMESLRKDGTIMAFLPTELKTGFPCLLNSDFLLTASRDFLKVDNEWNEHLLHAASEMYAEFLELMIQNCLLAPEEERIGGPLEMWLSAIPTTAPQEAAIKLHFYDLVRQNLKFKRICFAINTQTCADEFVTPENCFVWSRDVTNLLRDSSPFPKGLSKHILHPQFHETRHKMAIVGLGVRQKVSLDFLGEVLQHNVDWIRQRALDDDGWIVNVIHWISRECAGLPAGIDPAFVKKIIPLLKQTPDLSDFASDDDQVYLKADPSVSRDHLPADICRIVKPALVDQLDQHYVFLRLVGVNRIFSEREFADKVREALPRLVGTTSFIPLSLAVCNIYAKDQNVASLNKTLVRLSNGTTVNFENSVSCSSLRVLSPLWDESTEAAWDFIPLTLHPNYAKEARTSTDAISKMWHDDAFADGFPYPAPPRTQPGVLRLPPALAKMLENVAVGGFVNDQQKYLMLLRLFFQWIRKASVPGPITIVGNPPFVPTTNHEMMPQVIVDFERQAWDQNNLVPLYSDDESRDAFARLFVNASLSQPGPVALSQFCRNIYITFPNVTGEVVNLWTLAVSQLALRVFGDVNVDRFPDITTGQWSNIQNDCVHDPEMVGMDDLLLTQQLKNLAHPKYGIAQAASRIRLASVNSLTLVSLIRNNIDQPTIMERLPTLYDMIAARHSQWGGALPGSYIACHGDWVSEDEVFVVKQPDLGPCPQAFREFTRKNLAADEFFARCPKFIDFITKRFPVATEMKPTHFQDALNWFINNQDGLTPAQRVRLAKWLFAKFAEMATAPTVLLSTRGELLPPQSLYLPPENWSLSESSYPKLQIVDMACGERIQLAAWGVKDISQVLLAPEIRIAPMDVAHPQLEAHIGALPPWFFPVLHYYITKKVDQKRFTASLVRVNDAKVVAAAQIVRDWKFADPHINVQPEEMGSCFKDGLVHVCSREGELLHDFLLRVIATIYIDSVDRATSLEIQKCCQKIFNLFFLHGLTPLTVDACIAYLESKINVDAFKIARISAAPSQ
eukprot:TRINITY_DN5889_c0_g1_i1.p1 TRINITY_DN5889_c0_g1~~TRINITY_DN5889_c0_g1_i1.p1  ORF type:complete len:1354 (-),score=253.76 TRINITY_DN5889_c0_g1_i1:17-3781(-)